MLECLLKLYSDVRMSTQIVINFDCALHVKVVRPYISVSAPLFSQLLRNDLEVTQVDLSEILPAATIMVVSVTASTTQGLVLLKYSSVFILLPSPILYHIRQQIEEVELGQVLEACDMVRLC